MGSTDCPSSLISLARVIFEAFVSSPTHRVENGYGLVSSIALELWRGHACATLSLFMPHLTLVHMPLWQSNWGPAASTRRVVKAISSSLWVLDIAHTTFHVLLSNPELIGN
jgi:hypothetical protein